MVPGGDIPLNLELPNAQQHHSCPYSGLLKSSVIVLQNILLFNVLLKCDF